MPWTVMHVSRFFLSFLPIVVLVVMTIISFSMSACFLKASLIASLLCMAISARIAYRWST